MPAPAHSVLQELEQPIFQSGTGVSRSVGNESKSENSAFLCLFSTNGSNWWSRWALFLLVLASKGRCLEIAALEKYCQ